MSFRGGPQDRTRNLEILRCAIAHRSSRFASPGMTKMIKSPADYAAGLFVLAATSSLSIAIEASAVAVCFSTPSLTQNTSAATTET